MRRARLLAVLFLVGVSTGAAAQGKAGSQAASLLGKLPLYFVENRGVYPEEVAYYVQGAEKTVFFTPGGVTFRLRGERRARARRSSSSRTSPR